MKRLYTIMAVMAAVIMSLPALAITNFGKLYYEFDSYTKTARVVRTTLLAYDEEQLIIIPPTVKYINTTYTVTEVSSSAFYGLYGLHAVEFPSTLTTIRENAFEKCTGLTSITLPASLTTLESNAFAQCTFQQVTCEAPTPPYCGGSVNAFSEETLSYGTLNVPRGSVDAYKQASGWSRFKTVRYIGQVDPTSITLDQSALTMDINTTRALHATILPANTTELDIAWKSSSPNTVSVDDSGNISAKNAGMATITATTTNGLSASCSVTVVKPVTALSISPVDDLYVGDTRQLYVTISPADATDRTLTYYSSSPSCIAVDANGRITAKALGSATITARASSGVNASTTIKVVPTPVESISIPSATAMYIGEKKTLEPIIYPESATYKNLTWKSSNPAVVYVDGFGRLSALAEGSANVTCTAHNGVSATTHVSVSPVEVSSISLSKTSLDLAVGKSATLIATILPDNATDKSVTWKSSDETVATVTQGGVVTGVGVGFAAITAMSSNGLTASCPVNVTIPVASISLDLEGMGIDSNTVELKATEQIAIKVIINPADATDQSLTFESSAPTKATVSPEGLVTAHEVGNAIISITASSGVKTVLNVKVIPTPAESVTLDYSEESIKVTETLKITAIVAPETTTDKTLIWHSSNPSVATVNTKGLVTGVALGEATITATATSGVSAECKISVIPTPAASIEIVPATLTLNRLNETQSLKAEILPATTTDKSVGWSSSDEAVATVSATGLVTATGFGEAVITAMTLDGTSLIATCDVSVVPILAQSITITPATLSLVEEETGQLSVEILPADATDKSVSWSSSDEAVATVDDEGLVTAIKEGEAVITALTRDGTSLIATCQLTVIPLDGIESILRDNVDAKVFDIAGHRVADTTHLTPGIYIIHAGQKRYKIIVK